MDKSENKSKEEIKELENKLREELEKDLNNKYLSEIESIKNEINLNKEEKERYKKELEEMKAKSKEDKYKSDEFKENYKLIADLKNAYSALISLTRQEHKMTSNKINISSDILEELERTMRATSILKNLKDRLK